ncbi:MAG: hypothetical protein OIN85_10050 [Candidatus Methanoperedens sp.]|nr:hypothetical protein [Candidatus Methanoperedens sp.]
MQPTKPIWGGFAWTTTGWGDGGLNCVPCFCVAVTMAPGAKVTPVLRRKTWSDQVATPLPTGTLLAKRSTVDPVNWP